MTTVALPLSASTLKSEEMAVLDRWVKEAGTQSYLSSFLSSAAREWLCQKIHEDSNTDLYAWYKAELDVNQKLAGDLSAVQQEYDAFRKAAASKDAQRQAEELRLANLLILRDSQHEAAALRMGERIVNVEDERNSVTNNLEGLLAKLQAAEAQILVLKARVLDLQDAMEQ